MRGEGGDDLIRVNVASSAMGMFQVVQMIMRTSMEVMILELGIKQKKVYWNFMPAVNMIVRNALFKTEESHI